MKSFLLLALLALLALPTLPAIALEPIEPTELVELVADRGALVVDVRTPAEYAAGHVPGAVNVPYDRLAAEPALLERWRDRPLVLYCRSGRRVAQAATSLEQAGFQLFHLRGDMPGWERRGEAVARGDSAGCLTC